MKMFASFFVLAAGFFGFNAFNSDQSASESFLFSVEAEKQIFKIVGFSDTDLQYADTTVQFIPASRTQPAVAKVCIQISKSPLASPEIRMFGSEQRCETARLSGETTDHKLNAVLTASQTIGASMKYR